MDRPIYNLLKKLSNDGNYPFHMPGHKRNENFLKDFYEFISLDFTEIDETDNFHNSKGIIKESKELMAKLFLANESYFLINGSSGGIMASLMACLKPGDKVLLARNCHISVYNGIILSGAIPIYIYPSIKYNIPCGIDKELVKKVILENSDIKVFILTSPTYEGFVSDIKELSNIAHENNIILIVDEAHGAHFSFSNKFPKSALEEGADIVIQSLHKTLPSLTQCSVLHLNSTIVNKDMLERCLSLIQTTSPSYIFMLSIEYCQSFIKNNLNLFEEYAIFLKEVRKNMLYLKNIKLVDRDILKDVNIVDFDISRFTFLINSNVNGNYINEKLKEYNIQIEMYSDNHIIAISTICDTKESLEKLVNALIKIDREIDVLKDFNSSDLNNRVINIDSKLISIPCILPRNAFYMEKKRIDFDLSENKFCGDFVTPYPPGIPLLVPGEIITKDIIEKIKCLIKNNINILGLQDNKISTIL